MMLVIVSRRLLPGRSGMKSVLSSRIWTNPGGSPRGETSARPLSPLVPMQRNGERSMNALQCLSSEGMHFFVEMSMVSPMVSRRSASSR